MLWCLESVDGGNFFPWALASLIPSATYGIPRYFDDAGNLVELYETNYFLLAMTTYEPVIPKADALMPVEGLDGSPIYEPCTKTGFANQTQAAYGACAIAFRLEVQGKTKVKKGGSDMSSVLSSISRTSKRRMSRIAEDPADDQPNQPDPSQKRIARVPNLVLLVEWRLEGDDVTPRGPIDKSIVTYK